MPDITQLNHLEKIWYNFIHSATNFGYLFYYLQKIWLQGLVLYRGILKTTIKMSFIIKHIAYSWYIHNTYYGPGSINVLYINWFMLHILIMRLKKQRFVVTDCRSRHSSMTASDKVEGLPSEICDNPEMHYTAEAIFLCS